ncbi:hypothetical protein LUX12_11555 [Streptomyces somaliensis]|uniref:hypothetical protein n=1 Tax=Streptomyces somaliensis TaxID=78355 RepID=UPI0020CF42F7|nr:hypothetical protein [Streptomyces somaliensis]MCP9945272.1 hypothetical protein [Streptomyces somaliensis]
MQRMLRGAVEGLEPSAGALDHLRRAVPARRARKRQALVGAAAAVILLGTGVPALVHVAASGGASDADPVNAGHGAHAESGDGGPAAPASGGRSGEPGGPGKDGVSPERVSSSAAPASGGADGAPGRAAPSAAALPACEAGQLAVSAADVGAPGGDGTVHGAFRVTNVSPATAPSAPPVRSVSPRAARPTRGASASSGTRPGTGRPACPTRPRRWAAWCWSRPGRTR